MPMEELFAALGPAERAGEASLPRAVRGGIALGFGPAGVGKTRLTDEVATRAREQGAEVLVGRCHEGAGALPFWPWLQVVRGYAAARPLLIVLDDLQQADLPSLQLLRFLVHALAGAPLCSSPPVAPGVARAGAARADRGARPQRARCVLRARGASAGGRGPVDGSGDRHGAGPLDRGGAARAHRRNPLFVAALLALDEGGGATRAHRRRGSRRRSSGTSRGFRRPAARPCAPPPCWVASSPCPSSRVCSTSRRQRCSRSWASRPTCG